MTRDALDQHMWDAFARCVPDEQIRRAIAMRAITAQAAADPRVAAALEVLAGATSAERDAAFARAVQRGTFTPAETEPDRTPPFKERVRHEVQATLADLNALIDRLTAVFVLPLVPSPATLGTDPDRPWRGDTFDGTDAEHEVDDHRVFRFAVPEDLTHLGLASRGSAELDDRNLEVRVRTTTKEELPALVVIAVADGEATDVAVMRQRPHVISATLPWDYPGAPDDIVLAVAAQT